MSNPLCQIGGTMKNKKLKISSPGEGQESQNVNQSQNQNAIAVSITVKPGPAPAPGARKPKRRPRVALEPELEEVAAMWSAAKRFEMARKFLRWSRQLRISAFILFHDSHRPAPPSLPYLGLRKARLN
jgi:hypothetical protein